jgi:hypothetical protein
MTSFTVANRSETLRGPAKNVRTRERWETPEWRVRRLGELAAFTARKRVLRVRGEREFVTKPYLDTFYFFLHAVYFEVSCAKVTRLCSILLKTKTTKNVF